MDLIEIKNDLSIRSKNGIPFLLSATIIWIVITVIYLQPFAMNQKNIYMLFSTGLMFPLSVMMSKMIKADWRSKDNSLGDLGLYLNLAQLMYFPLLFWAFAKSPNETILVFAVITGAHFFPYGWFYNTKAYYLMAPIISIMIMVIGWRVDTEDLWFIPLAMVFSLLILIAWLFLDYRNKVVLCQDIG